MNAGSHHGDLAHSLREQQILNPPLSLDPFVTRSAAPKGTQAGTVQGATSTSHPTVRPAKPQVSCAQLKQLERFGIGDVESEIADHKHGDKKRRSGSF
jgi:hypothetical protein